MMTKNEVEVFEKSWNEYIDALYRLPYFDANHTLHYHITGLKDMVKKCIEIEKVNGVELVQFTPEYK